MALCYGQLWLSFLWKGIWRYNIKGKMVLTARLEDEAQGRG